MGLNFRTDSAEALYDYMTDSVDDGMYGVMPDFVRKVVSIDEALADATEFANRVRDAVEAGEAVTLFGVDYEPVGKGGSS